MAIDDFEKCLNLLRKLDWPRDQFCITGSAALHMLSKIAVRRGHPELISREPNDIDVLVIGDALKRARDISQARSSLLGRGELLSLRLRDGKGDCLDLASAWPLGPEVITPQDLRDISHEIDGIRVMREEFIVAFKKTFKRLKDEGDIQHIDKHIDKALTHKINLTPFPWKP